MEKNRSYPNTQKTTFFLSFHEQSTSSCMRTLWELQLMSGLKGSTMKTKGVKIGVVGDKGMNLCTDLDSIWTWKI